MQRRHNNTTTTILCVKTSSAVMAVCQYYLIHSYTLAPLKISSTTLTILSYIHAFIAYYTKMHCIEKKKPFCNKLALQQKWYYFHQKKNCHKMVYARCIFYRWWWINTWNNLVFFSCYFFTTKYSIVKLYYTIYINIYVH